MTNEERARLGGLALREKVSNSYFAFIGRRGGRNNIARELRELAADNAERCPTMAEHYQGKADGWAVPVGNMIMVELWTKENCPPLPRRQPASGDITKLRRWQKINS